MPCGGVCKGEVGEAMEGVRKIYNPRCAFLPTPLRRPLSLHTSGVDRLARRRGCLLGWLVVEGAVAVELSGEVEGN